MTKTDMVRESLKQLGRNAMPRDIQEYIRGTYAVNVSTTQISSVKNGELNISQKPEEQATVGEMQLVKGIIKEQFGNSTKRFEALFDQIIDLMAGINCYEKTSIMIIRTLLGFITQEYGGSAKRFQDNFEKVAPLIIDLSVDRSKDAGVRKINQVLKFINPDRVVVEMSTTPEETK